MGTTHFAIGGLKLSKAAKIFQDEGLTMFRIMAKVYVIQGTPFTLAQIPVFDGVMVMDTNTGMVMDLPDEDRARAMAISIRQLGKTGQAEAVQLTLGGTDAGE